MLDHIDDRMIIGLLTKCDVDDVQGQCMGIEGNGNGDHKLERVDVGSGWQDRTIVR